MRILIDIGHPAHVHYFRYFIKNMQEKGHEFLIVARDKEVSQILLEKFNILFSSRGEGAQNMLGKLIYLFKADWFLLNQSKRFDPDLFISFASPYAAHVSKIIGKPHIALTDTENAKFGIVSFAPFTECILTPKVFKRDFGAKHIRFDSFMELSYLHPAFFKPDKKTICELGVKDDEKIVLLRFVSWHANHDIGQTGLTNEDKIIIVKELSKYARIFISAEGEIPDEIAHFKIKISPEKMHDVLYFADLYIGEGATMASECAMLGTPAIYINSLSAGTLEEQEKYGLIYSFRSSKGILEKAKNLLTDDILKENHRCKCYEFLSTKINPTPFFVWFVENYPDSIRIMRENPDYQYNFK